MTTETNLASLYRELMDDPLRVAGPGELESDEPAPDACDHRQRPGGPRVSNLYNGYCIVCGNDLPALSLHMRYVCCNGQDCGCQGETLDNDVCSVECHENKHHRSIEGSEREQQEREDFQGAEP